jgi:hypothetical protein
MKTWYLSKTLWFNAITVVALLLQSRFGFILDPEIQTGLLAVINLILRAVTGQPLDWKPSATDDSGIDPPHFIPPATAGFIRLPLLFAKLIILSILSILMFAGCATFGQTSEVSNTSEVSTAKDTPLQKAGKSLLAVKATIVTSATAVDAFCKAGKIGPDKCAQAKDAYDKSKPAYDAAINAYLLMSQGYGDPNDFGIALVKVQGIAASLLTLSGIEMPGGAK